ncbi:MAG: metallophosphoesterase [Clostridia bacterium]|nr:metallophosphoesterase [Clostridia bacterium]
MNTDITFCSVRTGHELSLTLAVAADIHDFPVGSDVLRELDSVSPDYILIPGDLFEGGDEVTNSFDFIRSASEIAPTFFSFGNHDTHSESVLDKARELGLSILDDSFVDVDGVRIGGLSSGIREGKHHAERTPPPNTGWLEEFCGFKGMKILLNHHPEYYIRYLRDLNIDLVVSGHAHGGQWRFFGRGVYAPGQGIFPRYTAGVEDGRLVISRGMANRASLIPRINNRPELVIIRTGHDCSAETPVQSSAI